MRRKRNITLIIIIFLVIIISIFLNNFAANCEKFSVIQNIATIQQSTTSQSQIQGASVLLDSNNNPISLNSNQAAQSPSPSSSSIIQTTVTSSLLNPVQPLLRLSNINPPSMQPQQLQPQQQQQQQQQQQLKTPSQQNIIDLSQLASINMFPYLAPSPSPSTLTSMYDQAVNFFSPSS
jgi:FtsZ-interacting cell division protein ZipA